MKPIRKEDKAGLYLTVIIHLAVLIVLLAGSLGYSLRRENSFVLDFSKYEDIEKMQAEIARLQKEAEFKEGISRKLQESIDGGRESEIRNVAVDRSALKDDRGTDAEQLYKDAERLQKELDSGFEAPEPEAVTTSGQEESSSRKEQSSTYRGPSVVSYELAGRKASKLPIPAYRCMGAGEVKVLITADPSGTVTSAKVEEGSSSTDECLRAYAIRAARLSKFSAKADAPARQAGYIVYSFIAQ